MKESQTTTQTNCNSSRARLWKNRETTETDSLSFSLDIRTCLMHKLLAKGVSTEHSHPIWLTLSGTQCSRTKQGAASSCPETHSSNSEHTTTWEKFKCVCALLSAEDLLHQRCHLKHSRFLYTYPLLLMVAMATLKWQSIRELQVTMWTSAIKRKILCCFSEKYKSLVQN